MTEHWMDTTPGWILPYEEAFLQSLACTLREGARAVNIGGGAGSSSAAILRGTCQLENFALASVDLVECPEEKEYLKEAGLWDISRVIQVVEDSVEFGKRQETPILDLVFVDGSHEEKHVLADIKTFARLMKPGGLLVVHDYEDPSQPQVTRAVNRWLNYKRGGGKEWIEIGKVLYTLALMKPTKDMEWAKERL